MKKIILLIIYSLMISAFTYGQKDIKDIKMYNVWSSYDESSGKWSEWKENDEVFILNYKDTNSIARCRLNKKILIYRVDPDTSFEKKHTPSGHSYTIIKARGSDFLSYEFKFFDNNPDYGLELKVGAVELRFAKK